MFFVKHDIDWQTLILRKFSNRKIKNTNDHLFITYFKGVNTWEVKKK